MGLDPSAPLAARSALNRAERRVFLRYIVLSARLHGTVKTVPYKPSESSQLSFEFIDNLKHPGTAQTGSAGVLFILCHYASSGFTASASFSFWASASAKSLPLVVK